VAIYGVYFPHRLFTTTRVWLDDLYVTKIVN